jgi:hypothetical protein
MDPTCAQCAGSHMNGQRWVAVQLLAGRIDACDAEVLAGQMMGIVFRAAQSVDIAGRSCVVCQD